MFSSDNRKKLLAPPVALSRVVFLNVAGNPLLRYPPSQPQIPRGQWGNGAMEFFSADVKIIGGLLLYLVRLLYLLRACDEACFNLLLRQIAQKILTAPIIVASDPRSRRYQERKKMDRPKNTLQLFQKTIPKFS